MARAIFQNMGGGGSGSSDDCTATRDKVLAGYTAITSDSNDEPISGTIPTNSGGTIAHSCTTYNGYFYLQNPYGYYPPSYGNNQCETRIELSKAASAGQLTASKLLSGQSAFGVTGTATSDATATANYIYNGKTAYKNGQKITGTMTVSSILSFDYAAYSTTQVLVKWQNPSKGPFSGVVICAKQGGYPTTPDDNRKYTGYGDNQTANGWSNTIISGLTSGVTYYFRMWWYASCSAGDMFSSTVKQFTCAPIASGRQVFTSSTTWTVPTGVKSINIHCTGGGASGTKGSYDRNNPTGGKGGGGGYTAFKKNVTVSPGQQLAIVVGNGGVAPTSYIHSAGRTSSVSSNGIILVSANGGNTKVPGSPSNSSANAYITACGGSGGGRCAGYDLSSKSSGYGGSDGNNGYFSERNMYLGQGTTTREFGNPGGTLYSGGGGGGGCTEYISGSESNFVANGNVGGTGGGGNGSGYRENDQRPGVYWNESGYYNFITGNGANGANGTGGGGGGGCLNMRSEFIGGNGGSGNVVISW